MKHPIILKKRTLAIAAAALAAFLLAGCAGPADGAGTTGERAADAAGQAAGAESAVGQAAGATGAGMKPSGRTALTGEPIRIGAIYALSGNNAAIGTNILRGIDFAAEDINAAGGVDGRPIE